jgi:hypothetical protein
MNFSHQSELFDPNCAKPVTYVGLGSVGCWGVYFLAKMGITDITVYDGKQVASHNVPMSLYTMSDVGQLKAHVLAERVRQLTDVEIKVIPENYAGEELTPGSVIISVDDMPTRDLIRTRVDGKLQHDLLIDTRTAEMFVEVLTVQPWNKDDMADYKKTMFTNKEARLQTCGRHGVVFATTRAAGIAVSNLANYWMTGDYRLRVAEKCDILERVI